MRAKALIFIALAAMATGCSESEGDIAGSGLIEADEILVSAEAGGRVLEKFFSEGSDVEEGDILLAIDSTRTALRLRAAHASLEVAGANLETARIKLSQAEQAEEYARSELARVVRLRESGTASERQHDRAEFEHDTAVISGRAAEANLGSIRAEMSRIEAEIARLEEELDDTRPRSPASGTVLTEFVDRGELLAPGRPIASIAGLDTVYVKVYLAAGSFARVRLGDSAEVDTESGGKKFDGTVVWTAQEAEFTPKNVQTGESRAGLVYAVKVSVPNPDRYLKVGMPVYVTLDSR